MTKYLNLDLDQTLGGSSPSDYTIPSQKAIKAYVDNNSGGLPSQTGQSGKFLTTDGTDASWGTIPSDSTKANASLNNLDSTGQAVIDGKVDLNAANLSTAGKSLISGLGMPSNRYIDLTLGASGSTYTAPANGLFCVGGYNSSAGIGSVTIRTSLLRVVSNASNNEWGCACFFPVKKGDVVYIDYKNITTWLNKFFIYAEGEPNV